MTDIFDEMHKRWRWFALHEPDDEGLCRNEKCDAAPWPCDQYKGFITTLGEATDERPEGYPEFGSVITCSHEGCDEQVANHKWAKVKSDWFFQMTGQAWCPAHHPEWVAEWRSKRDFGGA